MKFSEIKIFNHDVFHDHRGDLWTLWKKNEYPDVELEFNHDKISMSTKHVLRGIHGDYKSWKMVECLFGQLYFVVVDNRPDSETYREWDWMMLSDEKRQAVLLPPGFGNGFLVMSDISLFHYKWAYGGEYPDVDEQFTIKWDDPKLKIRWAVKNPILQQRDL